MTNRSLILRLLALACAHGAWSGHAWAASAIGSAAHPHHAHAVKKATARAPAVDVSGAWVRATVPGQSGSGGFMSLLSKDGPLQLVGFSTPMAGSAELHEMAMDGAVMRMRPVDAVDLPAGQRVELKPGGHHLMLMGLKQPLKAGTTLSLVLRLKTPEGALVEQTVDVPVRSSAPPQTGAPAASGSAHGHLH